MTGYGYDNTPASPTGWQNTDSGTEQTDIGPYLGENSSGDRFWHLYRIDTEAGNSGSPIIWDGNDDFSIGIHTFGNCTPTGGYNGGTSFEHDSLENAIQNFLGGNTIYVDHTSMHLNLNGTIFRAFYTVQEGVNATPAGGRLYITNGTYNGNSGLNINSSITILPPACGVILINP